MVDEAKIRQAVNAVQKAAPPGSRVIVFGSCALGGGHKESDIDLMVVEPVICRPWKEAGRLRRAIGSIGVPVDVVVTDRREFDFWKNSPRTVFYEAATKGREYGSAT